MRPSATAVIDAVADLQAERNELRALLAAVAAGSTATTPSGNAVVIVPENIWAEIRLRVEANADR
jgi:hypothetical protein